MSVRAIISAPLAAALVLALAGAPVMAQDAAQDLAATDDTVEVEAPLPSPDDSAVLGQALALDPAHLAGHAPAKALSLPSLKHPKTFDISRTNAQPDGSGTVVVKQALPVDWDAKIGADVGVAGEAPDTYHPQRPLAAPGRSGNSGAAWASVGVSNVGSIDARVDPTNDQGRLAGTLKHSMPVGGAVSVTLQNSYSVTDTFSAQGAGAPAGLPMIALPQDGGSAPSQVFGSERIVKFDVLPTGTTLAAGLASSSIDPVTHNRLSAEQKLLGPLSVTTAVTDVGQTTVNKSISAGFKLKW